ncbi:hypothetical protein [Streptomyces flaveolus]|uniref:hypothetical protein n=1 Tax=Streptomyces flaveolus TaxID=67297 RepID=UPI0033DC20E2
MCHRCVYTAFAGHEDAARPGISYPARGGPPGSGAVWTVRRDVPGLRVRLRDDAVDTLGDYLPRPITECLKVPQPGARTRSDAEP